MPRRILIVLRRLGTGGIEQATLTLANAMAAAGHEVHLLVLKGTPKHRPAPTVILHCRDFEREQRCSLGGRARDLLARLLLKPLLPDSGFVWQGLGCSRAFERFISETEAHHGRFALMLIRGQGAFELLWKVNDPRAWRIVESVTGRFSHRRLGRWLTDRLYQGHRVVCVSHGVQSELHAYLERQGVTLADSRVIHNAVPLEQLRECAAASHTPAFDAPYLVHVARLVPVKHQSLLLDAYHLACQQGLALPLLIIGDGSERRTLEAQALRLGIAERVHFLGQQVNPFPWVAGASALVLSSRFEGLGLVLIEALALGTQCVATDVPGGIREVLVDEQRRLLAPPTPEALAAKLCEAVERPVTIDPAWAQRFAAPHIVQAFLALIPDSDQRA